MSEEGQVVWGLHEVAEALEAGRPVERVYFARQAGGVAVERIKDLAKIRGVRYDFVDVGRLGRLAGTRAHQDVVARLSPVPPVELEAVLEVLRGRQTATLVVLDQVQNPANVGMVARTAAAAGADGLLLPARGGRGLSDAVVQASSGAIFRLPVISGAHLDRDLERLKGEGFWIFGLDAEGERDLYEVEWPQKRVLVAGNESKGLRPLTRKRMDALVRIPLASGVESLNVAVAVGVVLFEAGRGASTRR